MPRARPQVRAWAVVASVPRTTWAVSWGVRTGLAYTRCMASHVVRQLFKSSFLANCHSVVCACIFYGSGKLQ